MPEKTPEGYTLCAIKDGPSGSSRRRRRRPWYLSPDGFRELRRSCFLTRQACAEYLGVSLRTVRYWDAGRNRVPWAVVRLLRFLRAGDLGALQPTWSGWTLNRRGLVSPCGRVFDEFGMRRWWLTAEQASFWRRRHGLAVSGGVGALAPAGALLIPAAIEAGASGRPPSPSPDAKANPATQLNQEAKQGQRSLLSPRAQRAGTAGACLLCNKWDAVPGNGSTARLEGYGHGANVVLLWYHVIGGLAHGRDREVEPSIASRVARGGDRCGGVVGG
jgi:hypothetical protein